jgi:isopentenyldiphosphate isomerase
MLWMRTGRCCGCRGEHEIDYILLIQTPVTLKPNPEEVMDTKYVSYMQLLQEMQPESGESSRAHDAVCAILSSDLLCKRIF